MTEYPFSKKEADRLAKFIKENPSKKYKLVVRRDSGIGTTYNIMSVYDCDDNVVRGVYEDITDYDTW